MELYIPFHATILHITALSTQVSHTSPMDCVSITTLKNFCSRKREEFLTDRFLREESCIFDSEGSRATSKQWFGMTPDHRLQESILLNERWSLNESQVLAGNTLEIEVTLFMYIVSCMVGSWTSSLSVNPKVTAPLTPTTLVWDLIHPLFRKNISPSTTNKLSLYNLILLLCCHLWWSWCIQCS